jgi:hypothetical protein
MESIVESSITVHLIRTPNIPEVGLKNGNGHSISRPKLTLSTFQTHFRFFLVVVRAQ